MQGLLVAVCPPGSWRWDGRKNREYRALFAYFATEKEQNLILQQRAALEQKKAGMEEWRFENWLEEIKQENPRYYESQGIHLARLEDLTGSGLRIDEVFAHEEPRNAFIRFSSDLLLPLLNDPIQMEGIHSIIDHRAELFRGMSRIRGRLSVERYQDLPNLTDDAEELVRSLLENGTHPGNGLLRLLFRIGVYRKVMKSHNHLFLKGRSRSTLQVILVEPVGQQIFLQRRGPYKRLFPGKLTVSASCRWTDEKVWRQSAAEAVHEEVGISISPSRLEMFEPNNPRPGFLASYTFEALSEKEADALAHEASSFAASPRLAGVQLEYDAVKACLVLFSFDPKLDCRRDLYPLADAISRRTKVPFVYPVFERTEHRLAVYRLHKEETKLISESIARAERHRAGLPAALERVENPSTYRQALKELDRDSLVPLHWRLLCSALQEEGGPSERPLSPADFAMDMVPIFLKDERLYEWLELSLPGVLDVDHPAARLLSVAGGKGSNLHILRSLARDQPSVFTVPPAWVVTVESYKKHVHGNSDILQHIRRLDEEQDPETRKQTADAIQEQIKNIFICRELQSAIETCCNRLGPGPLMVRSSATVEDRKENSAAGYGRSFPAKGAEEVTQTVKKVWASLFTPEFVDLRWDHKGKQGFSNAGAGMAVIVQQAIAPDAAGVVTSVAATGLRPIFTVTARPGFGGKVVDNRGTVDRWQVGILGDVILEREDTGIKTGIEKFNSEGGLITLEEEFPDPSLSDKRILNVALASRRILEHYRKNGLAENIDVEFAVDQDSVVHVVQARSEPVRQCVNKQDGKRSVLISMVDPTKLPAGVQASKAPDKAFCVSAGTATAELQRIESEMAFDLTKNDIILVTHHTNNSWNDVFKRLKGVITEEGGETSHAAKNARALGIPCIVGWSGAVNALSQLDGQQVTIDGFNLTLYEGCVPTRETEVAMDLWLDDEHEINNNEEKLGRHEIARRWQEKKDSRPGIFKERFDGHWRFRSEQLPRFQLDCYYRAWDCLSEYLNNTYATRSSWTLAPQMRQIRTQCLFHLVPACDDRNIYHFLNNLKDITIQDALDLYDARSNAFDEVGRYFANLELIDANNVDEVVKRYVTILSWMHFAYWLNALVSERWLRHQLKYIATDSHDLLKETVAREDTERRRMDLSRDKDVKIHEIAAQLRCDPDLVGAVFSPDITCDQQMKLLTDRNPLIADSINKLSRCYKAGTENIAKLCDTDHYLKEIGQLLADGTLIKEKLLLRLFREYLENNCQGASTPDSIINLKNSLDAQQVLLKDKALHLLLSSWANGDLTKLIHDLLEKIAREVEREGADSKALSPFPALRSTLLVSRLETTLREDGHHLIVRMQRALAPMMMKVGTQFFREDSKRVFDLSTWEFVSLVKTNGGSLSRVGAAERHWTMISRMEEQLADDWSQDPRQSFETFKEQKSRFLEGATPLCSGDPDLENQLKYERVRLEERVRHLRSVLKVAQEQSTNSE